MKKIAFILIGLISIAYGIFVSTSLFPHLTPAFYYMLQEGTIFGPLWIMFSFIKGIAFICFGIGLIVNWRWPRDFFTIIMIICMSLNICSLVVQLMQKRLSGFDYYFEIFIIGIYIVLILLANIDRIINFLKNSK